MTGPPRCIGRASSSAWLVSRRPRRTTSAACTSSWTLACAASPRPGRTSRCLTRCVSWPRDWEQLGELVTPDEDQEIVHKRLDDLRASYAELYEGADAGDVFGDRRSSSLEARSTDASSPSAAQSSRPARVAAPARRAREDPRRRTPHGARRSTPDAQRGVMTSPDTGAVMPNIEGERTRHSHWPWHKDAPLSPGLTTVIPVEKRRPFHATRAARRTRSDRARRRRRQPVRRHGRRLAADRREAWAVRQADCAGLSLCCQSVRAGAPVDPGAVGAQPGLLLQLVVRPGRHRVLHEVGRRHGAHTGGYRDRTRPRVAAHG